jgi:hypothetical protein
LRNFYRARRAGESLLRRALRRPRTVAEGPNLVIHQPTEVLSGMDDFVRTMHARSGLLGRIEASTVSLREAERQTRDFIAGYIGAQAGGRRAKPGLDRPPPQGDVRVSWRSPDPLAYLSAIIKHARRE